MSPEHVLMAIDETKADLMRLPHQIDADEFKAVMLKSYAFVVLLEKLIVDLESVRVIQSRKLKPQNLV